MIGIGLDAVTEELFRSLRTDVPRGGLDWGKYWRIVDDAREIFGPWKVNCHTLVGLGETDRDLMAMFERLVDREIFSYLFCFNPEPDSRMAGHAKSTVTRWRRVQLAKFLLEEAGLPPAAFRYDAGGALAAVAAPRDLIERTVDDGWAFMTNGCPGEAGEPGCTRPMGSWRPSEAPRDYPYRPDANDLVAIRAELRLDELVVSEPGAPGPTTERGAPPAAGRIEAAS
jgi:biotin synthase